MNATIKARWVAALRSGAYRQTTGQLVRRGDDGYEHCALGVLCALAADEGVVELGFLDLPIPIPQPLGYRGEHGVSTTALPDEVVEWAGLPDAYGELDDISVMYLNDESRLSFVEIAGRIEEAL